MSDAFIGEIRAFGFNFAPYGWMPCNGQLISISQYTALFALLGTTYGGNGTNNFALPNLQGQVPMHWGTGPGGFNTVLGEVQGSPTVALLSTEMPAHTHTISAGNLPTSGFPASSRSAGPVADSYLSETTGGFLYEEPPLATYPNTPFLPTAIMPAGSSQPHENRQPFLVINFCIAYNGIFPARN